MSGVAIEGPRKPYVLVVWDDAHSLLDEMSEDEMLKAHHPTRIHTRGWAVISNEVGIYMAMEWLPNNDSGARDTWRGLTFIPRPMVIEEVVLTVQRPRKPRTKKQTESVDALTTGH